MSAPADALKPPSKTSTKPKSARLPPPKPAPGQADLGVSNLPVARVSKIIKADSEIHICSKEATFLIGVAAEFFLKKFVDSAYLKARTDSRKTIQLKDLTSAVRSTHELMFLEDMLPAPVSLQNALAMRAEKERTDALPPLATIDFTSSDEPLVAAPPPKNASKAYATIDRPGQTPFMLPHAALVSKNKSKSAIGTGGGGGAGGQGPVTRPKGPSKKASSPRAPKDFSTFKKKERLPSLPDSLPTRARKSGPPAVPSDLGDASSAPGTPGGASSVVESETVDQAMEEMIEM